MNSWAGRTVDGQFPRARGSSCLLMKIGLDGIGPYNLIALRLGIAFFAMSLIFLPRYRQLSAATLAKGVFMGIIFFLIFYGMVNGVNHTTASTAGFLTSTTVVMVPVLECLSKRTLPSKTIVISILLSVAGLFLLTAKDGIVFDTGAAYCLTGAFFHAVHIIVFARLAK